MMPKPKKQFVDATRELLNLSRESQVLVVDDLIITTHPDVFSPVTFFSSRWFASEVSKRISGEKVLIEVGCGTGIVSIQSAKENKDLVVYATDINPKADELTTYNAKANGVEDRVFTHHGDVFDSLPRDSGADTIFWAMPFGYLDPTEELIHHDWQVFDPGYRAIRKFFRDAENHLTKKGRLLIGFSQDIGHLELLESIAHENGYSLDLITETRGVEKDSVSMEIWEGKRF